MVTKCSVVHVLSERAALKGGDCIPIMDPNIHTSSSSTQMSMSLSSPSCLLLLTGGLCSTYWEWITPVVCARTPLYMFSFAGTWYRNHCNTYQYLWYFCISCRTRCILSLQALFLYLSFISQGFLPITGSSYQDSIKCGYLVQMFH